MTIIDQKQLAKLVPDEALRHYITEAVERDDLQSLKDFMSRQQIAYTIPRANHEPVPAAPRDLEDDGEDDQIGHRN